MIGLIHVVERNDDQNIVTIEFHDRSGPHIGSHFNDTFKFTLGSLSECLVLPPSRKADPSQIGELGAAFACRGTAETASLVHYRGFETWTTSTEWQYSLPLGENVVAIAAGGLAPPLDEDDQGIAGSGTVLVATDKGHIRFFTGSGLQKYLWSLGKEVVSMAAGKDWAMIAYRGKGVVADGQQNLEYLLVDTDTYEVVQEGDLPLMKSAKLKWIGFTDEQASLRGSLAIFTALTRSLDTDSRHVRLKWCILPPRPLSPSSSRSLGGRSRHQHARSSRREARVVLARRSQRSERSCHHSQGESTSTNAEGPSLMLLNSQGEERHPHFPTPLFQELDLQLPLLRLDVQGQLEEK